MEIEILEQKENSLLERKEVRFKISFEGATPTRADVKAKLVAMLTSDKKLTILDSIDMNFGTQTATGYAKVYDNVDALKIEPEYKAKRNAAADQAKEAPKAEAKEESVDDTPAEKAVDEPVEGG